MNLVSTTIGYPYIGENREWKRTVESFWKEGFQGGIYFSSK